MGRLIRKTAILLKIETTYGNDANPTGAANAQVVSNLSINPLKANNVSRDIIRAYLGNSEQLVGESYLEMGFDLEAVGSGSAGVAPAWGAALRACGFAETVTAGVRVDYTPISMAFESATIYWYDDGVLHKGLGARGTVTLDLTVGKKPVFSFKFVCLDGGTSTASLPATTLTAWQVPQIVTDANTGDLTFGATHAPVVAPTLSGGTPYPSQGLMVDLGIATPYKGLLGGQSVSLNDRKVTGSVKLELTAAQEVAFMSDVKLATLTSLAVEHGTVANKKVMVFMPAVQKIDPSKEEVNGDRLIGYKLNMLPVSGDDEIRIVTSY